MIVPRVRLDFTPALRRLVRLPKRMSVVTSQIINRQLTQSKGRQVKGLAARFGVTPQKRLKRRIILPKGAKATPDRLQADGLSLVGYMPGRYFVKGKRGRGGGFTVNLPQGASEYFWTQTKGQPFRITAKSNNAQLLVRRAAVRKRSKDKKGNRTWLPVHGVVIDTEAPGLAVRARVLAQLAREFPKEFNRRWKVELRKVFGLA